MKIKLRLLKRNDVSACARIVGMNYSEKYLRTSQEEIASMFSNAAVTPIYWVAEADGHIVGFAGYIQSWMDYSIYQIFWVNVLPDLQRRGVGQKLVRKLITEVRKKNGSELIQLTATKPNATYYRTKFGFKSIIKINNTPEYLMYLRVH